MIDDGAVQKDITSIHISNISLLVLAGVAMHIVYLAVNYGGGMLLRLPLPDFKAVLIMGSQKTLPIAIAVISSCPGTLLAARDC